MMTDAKRAAIESCFSQPEAEVRAEAQEPIGTLRNSSLGGLSIEIHAPDIAEAGMKLYAVQQPPAKQESQEPVKAVEVMISAVGSTHMTPAPCPDCEARANGDTVLIQSSELKKLQAKVAELKEKMFGESETFVNFLNIDHPKALGERDRIIAQQAERIVELESKPAARYMNTNAHMESVVAEQAALIEQCEAEFFHIKKVCLSELGLSLVNENVLAAIAAYRSQS